MNRRLGATLLPWGTVLFLACGGRTTYDFSADEGASTSGTASLPPVTNDAGSSDDEEPDRYAAEDDSVRSVGERNPNAAFRGHWSIGDDHSGYLDCHDPATPWGWWLTGLSADSDTILDELAPTANGFEWQRVYIEVDGDLSEEGVWGSAGVFPRRLVVTRLYYAAQPTTHDCE